MPHSGHWKCQFPSSIVDLASIEGVPVMRFRPSRASTCTLSVYCRQERLQNGLRVASLSLTDVKQPCWATSVRVWLEQKEEHMRRGLISAAIGLALAVTTAQAATDKDKDAQHTGGTAKGAAVGA